MYVRNLIAQASKVTGYCSNEELFELLSHAVESLSNEGNFDPMLGYLDIRVLKGKVVTLPRDVEVPLKINIFDQPTFSRSQLYEFTLNGIGSDTSKLTGYQWMDRAEVPISGEISSLGTRLKATAFDGKDTGKKITFYGTDVDHRELQETLVLNNAVSPQTSAKFRLVTRVYKEATVGRVKVLDEWGDLLSDYYPDETEPLYRQIVLSKPAAQVRMRYRRKTKRITGLDDWIPLHSDMAVILELRSMKKLSEGEGDEIAVAEGLHQKALDLIQKEQASRNAFNELAAQSEDAPATNLNILNRDSVIAADLFDDAARIFGPIGPHKIFDKMTRAVEVLNNKHPSWDGTVGWVDIRTSDGYLVTLPRYIETIIQLNVCGRPTMEQNRWSEFHLNGTGGDCGGMTPCGTWRKIPGRVVTLADPPNAQKLVAVAEANEDDGTEIRVFGWYKGKRIRTPKENIDNDDDPEWEDGFVIRAGTGNALPRATTPCVDRIERIVKQPSNSYIKLVSYDLDMNNGTLIGYYYPDETEPNYERIRLPRRCVQVRLSYRKRTLKITSFTDPLHLRSHEAVLEALRSIKFRDDNNYDAAEAAEAKARQFLTEEQTSSNPGETFHFQIDSGVDFGDPMCGRF